MVDESQKLAVPETLSRLQENVDFQRQTLELAVDAHMALQSILSRLRGDEDTKTVAPKEVEEPGMINALERTAQDLRDRVNFLSQEIRELEGLVG